MEELLIKLVSRVHLLVLHVLHQISLPNASHVLVNLKLIFYQTLHAVQHVLQVNMEGRQIGHANLVKDAIYVKLPINQQNA